MATVPAYPARFDLEAPEEVANWRPLVQWLLAIPHLVILHVLGYVVQVVWIISFFAVLFTKHIPEGLYSFQVMVMRYQARVWTYVLFMREDYPPFSFRVVDADDGADPPTSLSVDRPPELNRWLPLVKWLLLIPQVIVLFFLQIASFFVAVVAFFAVLFTGRFPQGMRNFLVGVTRWHVRVGAYALFLVDPYPPFSLQPSTGPSAAPPPTTPPPGSAG